MAKNKTAAELKAENKLLRKTNVALAIAGVVNNLIRWTALSFMAYCIYLSINSLSGRETAAQILINVLGDLKISESVAYVLGVGGVIYGVNERRLRQKTVKHMQGRNIKLEKKIDQKRSSSNLTEEGETNPVDKE